ncbi:MAG TPA: 3-oxoacid CoA-transferase subunit B [Oligella sp.]|jgi:3-oxoadipate CoA-transferase beta subunit|nr:3-oxoacid CoA-transferase subunit B [Oligella sp.]
MSNIKALNRDQIAALVANILPDGSYVNLGIGIPVKVSDHLPPDREIILHSENGILGMGRAAVGDEIDSDIVNAGRVPVTLLNGASITEHCNSFAMMRGGHLDYAILGGFQVAPNGDLANWLTDAPDAIAAIGGAMDLAVGAKNVIVMMEHNTKDGQHKLLNTCTYPLTGAGVVNKVYTDLAIIAIKNNQFIVEAIIEGLSPKELQSKSEAPLVFAHNLQTIQIDDAGKASLV